MEFEISHNRSDETIEAKVKWFRTLNLSERMELLCAYTDLALELNPLNQLCLVGTAHPSTIRSFRNVRNYLKPRLSLLKAVNQII